MFQKQYIFFLLFIGFQLSFSQGNAPKKDSLEMYKDVQNYSKKHNFTQFIHKLVFRPIYPKKSKAKRVVPINYSKFEGKIIRHINIETLDPFGFSEIDSTRKPRNWAERVGNSAHNKTKIFAIQNLLLIREKRPLDSLLVNESIRILRSQRYISRVAIETKLIAKKADSVDIFIRVLDSWSMVPTGALTGSSIDLALQEYNFLGTGHEFNSEYEQRFTDGKSAYNLEYVVPNIKNTFIRTSFKYNIDLDGNYGKSIQVDRPFYSPFAKWAGGIYVTQQFRTDTVPDINLVYARQGFKYNSHDFWLGRAFRISDEKTVDERLTKLIVAARFLNVNYKESPTITYDPIDFYSSEQFFLSGIGISTRKYVQDKFIFRNGVTEDVPIGKIFGITAGYQNKNHEGRFYAGARLSFGNYHSWGFLSSNFELGSFFEKSTTAQTAISFQADYFTGLIDVGRWKLRQFVKPQVIIGINRQNSIGDQLSINENSGIRGFNSAVYGNQKMILTFQTQAYSPWNFFGFRLNPYINYTIAMLGNEETSVFNSKAFTKIGIGLIINNDYLVFQTFQISLAFYPTIPGSGNNVIKTNSFSSSDFGFQDFGLDKPRTVIYK